MRKTTFVSSCVWGGLFLDLGIRSVEIEVPVVGDDLIQIRMPCNLERRSLNRRKFTRHYRHKMPVILKNASNGWHAHTAWSRDNFTDKYGDMQIFLRTQLVHHVERQNQHASIRDFVSQQNESLLAFSFAQWKLWAALQHDLTPFPNVLRGVFEEFAFTLGHKHTGSGLHRHNENWITQIQGRKAWLLAAPTVPGVPNTSLPCSLLRNDESVETLSMEVCVVGQGETIYIPGNWYHGTCNLDHFTLGVGFRGGAADDSEMPLHHEACYRCDLANLKHAIDQKNISVESEDGLKQHLLHVCAKVGCVEASQYLIDERADINAKVEGKAAMLHAQPLHFAAVNGHADVVELLLRHRARTESAVNGLPIHYAATNGHSEVIGLLASYRADLSPLSSLGVEPLHSAASKGHLAVVQQLVSQRVRVAPKNKEGHQPIHLAASNGHTAVVELLIAQGSSPAANDHRHHQPIHHAAEHGYVDVIEFLLTQRVHTAAETAEGAQPMHFAASKGHIDTAKCLASHGASATATEKHGGQPMHFATQGGHVALVEFFASQRAQVGAEDKHGTQPIHIAAHVGNHAMRALMKRLLAVESMQHKRRKKASKRGTDQQSEL